MVVERERIIERPVEKETVVEADGGGGATALLAGVLIAALLGILFFWIFTGNRTPTIDIEVPTTSAPSK